MSTYKKLRMALSIFTGIGFILYLVAFIIPKWSKHQSGHDGLWQMCYMNGGVETCSVWTDELKTASVLTVQIFSCLGLIFYGLFFFIGALTIFWTNNWRKSKALKYSTFAFAVLAVIFIAVSVAVYKNDKGSGDKSLNIAWYIAVVGCAFAGVLAPFYFIDGYRTVPPPKPDKVKFFQNINVPPKPTRGFFEDKEPDTLKFGNRGRPPLLNELRKQKTSFVHPPPKEIKTKLTLKDIETFPLPPTKTKLDLFEKSEKEEHPAPQIPILPPSSDDQTENSSLKKKSDDSNDTISTATPRNESRLSENSSVNDIPNHSVFKFHKTKTVQKKGKTMLKIQNEGEKLPPVMMIMPGVDENGDEIVDENGRSASGTRGQEASQWEQEQARRKFGTYFSEVVNHTYNDEKPTEKIKKKSKSEIEKDKTINDRITEASKVYDYQGIKEIPIVPKPKKRKKHRKHKKKKPSLSSEKSFEVQNVETLVDIYGAKALSKHDSVTIFNEIEEDEEEEEGEEEEEVNKNKDNENVSNV